MTTIEVNLPPVDRSYPIALRSGLLAGAGKAIADKLGPRRAVIVTDENVAPLYLEKLEQSLAAGGIGFLQAISVPAGEGSKSFVVLNDVVERILASGADRQTVVIALGGGVVGDLAGCAAALALRGMDLVQIPTTLLAQVDSSIGGKNGVNGAHGKNTIGAFYQPRMVLIDPETLNSLPMRELLAGYAEVVKYGLIRDAAFFDWCVAHAERLIDGDSDARIYAIRKSCEHKAEIVVADEKEAGDRALLNLGHSFGHALEAAFGYDGHTLLHGEAVAIGTVLAFRLSAALGLCPPASAAKVEKHFADTGLPIKPPKGNFDVAELMRQMAKDKKAIGGELTLILARDIGKSFAMQKVDPATVQKIWQESLL